MAKHNSGMQWRFEDSLPGDSAAAAKATAAGSGAHGRALVIEYGSGGRTDVRVNRCWSWHDGVVVLKAVMCGTHVEQGASARLATDPQQQLLMYSSPAFPGVHNYVWDANLNEWVGRDDGHLLVELAARDLVTFCQGVPDF